MESSLLLGGNYILAKLYYFQTRLHHLPAPFLLWHPFVSFGAALQHFGMI